MKESAISQEDVALKEMAIATAREAQDQAGARTMEKHEQLCELSRALAVLASASTELYNAMVKKEGKYEEEAMKVYRAVREETDQDSDVAARDEVSSELIDRVDAMLQNLEKYVDAKIGDRWRLLDRFKIVYEFCFIFPFFFCLFHFYRFD